MKNKNEVSALADETVVNNIYEIRGQKVMLDSDLAALYGVPTKRINEQVNRNADRFPDDFMFQLSEKEWQNLKSQIATSSWGGRRKLPYAFTEHGVLMLSSVLNSPQAIQVNIQIVRIFTRLRKLLDSHNELKLEIADIKQHLHNHDKNIELVFTYLDELVQKKAQPRKRIGYKPDDL